MTRQEKFTAIQNQIRKLIEEAVELLPERGKIEAKETWETQILNLVDGKDHENMKESEVFFEEDILQLVKLEFETKKEAKNFKKYFSENFEEEVEIEDKVITIECNSINDADYLIDQLRNTDYLEYKNYILTTEEA